MKQTSSSSRPALEMRTRLKRATRCSSDWQRVAETGHNFLAMFLPVHDDKTADTVVDDLPTDGLPADDDNLSLPFGDHSLSDVSTDNKFYKGSNYSNLRPGAHPMLIEDQEAFNYSLRNQPCQVASIERMGRKFYGFGELPVTAIMNCQNSYHLHHLQVFVQEDLGSCFVCQLDRYGRIHLRPEIDDVHIHYFNFADKVKIEKDG